MFDFTSFDRQMFIWRAIIFLAIVAIFIIASVIVKNNISYREEYLKDKKSLLRKRWIIVAILYFLGLTIAVFAILELINNNPNEWLVFKIVCYILIWIGMPAFIIADNENEKYYWVEIVAAIFSFVLPLMMIIAFSISLYLANTNDQLAKPARRIIDSKTIVAIKEGSRVDNKTFGSLLFRISKSSEEVIYEYYYQNDDDGSEWAQIGIGEVTILPLNEGEEMHLDLVEIGIESTHFRNQRPYQDFQLEETRYELYLPKDYIVEQYEFYTQ